MTVPNVFPVPLFNPRARIPSSCPSACNVDSDVRKVANDAIRGLNWLSGFPDSEFSNPNAIQDEVRASVWELADRGISTLSASAPSSEQALRELLKGTSVYEILDPQT